MDVCTDGELETALSAGLPGEIITMHGNNKTVAELARALDAGVGRIVLDSFEEIARLAYLAERSGARPKVLVRVTTGVDAGAHAFIATAHDDQKFGFSLASGAAAEAVRRVLGCPDLELAGLHSHIGSQITDAAQFVAGGAADGRAGRRDQGRARGADRRTRPRRRVRHRLHGRGPRRPTRPRSRRSWPGPSRPPAARPACAGRG